MNKAIYDQIRGFFPVEKERKIVEKLIHKWKKDKTHIHISYKDPPKNPTYPLYTSMGVIAGDWPGFSEAVLAPVHEKGWNLSYISGVSLEMEGTQLGIIIFLIKLQNEEGLKKFIQDKNEIMRNIRSISIGSLAKRLLLRVESKRLEVYSKVVDIIEKKANKEDLKYLLGPEGEAFKFFASRTKAYITERSSVDLAMEIINNYKIQKDVLKSKGEIQIYIKNLKTSREHLTGITVGVFERDMLLKEILDALSFVLPDTKIVYNKEFTTPDGVLIARIEMCDEEGNPYLPSYHKRIKKVLKRLYTKGRAESGRVLETQRGFEHYMRAIIPLLLKEFNKSKFPQVFFSITESTEFSLEFKIIIVTKKKDPEKKIRKLLEKFDRIDGLTLLSTLQPKVYGDSIVLVFDVRGDLDKFKSQSDLYDEAKKVIKKVVGEIRDFDEGMRKIDTIKLQSVLKNLPDIPEMKIKRIYYSLEDFWRMNASTSDITKIIEFIQNLLKKYKKGKMIKDLIELRDGTGIVIISSKDKSVAGRLLEVSSECNITLSKIELPTINILFALLSHNGKPLDKDKVSKILSKITS